jgi:predicted GNAT family acetyltransferase
LVKQKTDSGIFLLSVLVLKGYNIHIAFVEKELNFMTIDLNALEVIRNEEERRFEVWIDGTLSKLDYIQDGKNFVITHVGVHPDLRGQGVAGRIVQAGLEYARGQNLRVVPMCSYAAAYIRKHPEYAELTRQIAE